MNRVRKIFFYTFLSFFSIALSQDCQIWSDFPQGPLNTNVFNINSLIYCIKNKENSFQEAVRMVGKWRSINKRLRNLLDENQHKEQIWSVLIEKFRDYESSNNCKAEAYRLLKSVHTPQRASDMLFDLVKGEDPFKNQYDKRNSTDLLFMNMFIIKALHIKGSSIHNLNVIVAPGMNTLLFASFEASLEFVQALLIHGVNPNQSSSQSKKTPLMVARMMARENIFKLLLRYGADINATDDSGRTVFADQYRGISKHDLKRLIREVNPKLKLKRSFITWFRDNF